MKSLAQFTERACGIGYLRILRCSVLSTDKKDLVSDVLKIYSEKEWFLPHQHSSFSFIFIVVNLEWRQCIFNLLMVMQAVSSMFSTLWQGGSDKTKDWLVCRSEFPKLEALISLDKSQSSVILSIRWARLWTESWFPRRQVPASLIPYWPQLALAFTNPTQLDLLYRF